MRHMLTLGFLAVVILFSTGQMTLGLAGAFIWIMFRTHWTDARIEKQIEVTHVLLQILSVDIPAADKEQEVKSYIAAVNTVREKQHNDWLFRLQNYGLAADDPRRVH